jgi:glucosamine-6-phosphate deaminase
VSVSLLVVADAHELSHMGALTVSRAIAERPDSMVVVPTGTTPLGLYAELATRADDGSFDPSQLTPVQLDEYLGLEPDDRRSFFRWMRRSFLEPLAIGEDRVLRLPLDGDPARFDRTLADRGGIDLAILGLGGNGHLGFNEPPSDRDSPTRRVRLTPETLEANARYWGRIEDVPTEAVTIGLGSLLAARHILLVVQGSSKHAIVRRALEGPVGPDVPASFLQETAHVTVIVDRAAWEGSGGEGSP